MKFHLLAAVASLPLARPFTGASGHSPGVRAVSFAVFRPLVALGRGLAQTLDHLFQAIERSECAQREAFFAEAVDLCDLEYRIRHYEHTGLTHY